MNSFSILSKVIHFKDTRQVFPTKRRNVNNQADERRDDQRTLSDERLFVQIVESQDSGLNGSAAYCNAVDVFANGLRIQSGAPIPEGSKIDV
ncbi:MAG: hypothetical protein ACI9CE_000083 [Flavobacterium sp.]|jgi:hypothetical protein